MKILELCHWCHSSVFIVNRERRIKGVYHPDLIYSCFDWLGRVRQSQVT